MEEIDDLFRNEALNEKGEFKPEYWDEFSSNYLEKKKKKRGFYFFLFGSLLFLVAIVGYYSVDKSFNEMDKEIVKNVKQDIPLTVLNTEAKTNEHKINEVKKLSENKFIVNSENKKEFENITIQKLVVEKNEKKLELRPKNNKNTLKVILKKTEGILKIKPPQYTVIKENDSILKNKIDSIEIKMDSNLIVFTINTNEIDSNKASKNKSLDSTKFNVVPDVFVSPKIVKNLVDYQFSFVFGGIGYSDYSILNNNVDLRYGLVAGVDFELKLYTKFSLSAAIIGYNRTSNTTKLTFENIDEGFGKNEDKVNYNYSDFYFMEIPLNINYVFGNNHKIGFGPVYTRLLTTRVKKHSEIIDFNTQTVEKTNSDFLIYNYETFELNNFGIGLNYHYLFKKITLNIGYTQGLNEFISKKTFNSTFSNRLNKFQISVQYKI